MTGELVVSRATPDDWRLMEQWAADEGWNPGRGDSECCHPTDPAGFFLGRLDGRPVSAVSVVRSPPATPSSAPTWCTRSTAVAASV